MACGGGTESLINQLSSLVKQIDKGPSSCCSPCCMPLCCPPICGDSYCITSCADRPYVQCTMLCPPPCVIPIAPQPVKPLQLPCPKVESETGINDGSENIHSRHANFYNNYNVDYRSVGHRHSSDYTDNCTPEKKKGTTVDGASPCCEDYTRKRQAIRESKQPKAPIPGCPTGFKPCAMKLVSPPNCDPAGIWLAQVQPCPPKPKRKVSNLYKPGQCKRPGCKHWEPKEGKCLYDEPCKAHCFNHPPGIKPRKRH